MNLAIHGIEGKIIEDNSFYSNPHNLTGKCDFVMANPPFNVDKIDKNKDFVKEDPRLPFGTPNNDNGNYMWVQYFHSYLNDNGRAGFVMPSSATDAGGSEKLIRQQLLETGDIEAIVSVTTKFFYGKFKGPCHIWFLNKNKQDKGSVLMIEARNTFRKVNTNTNDFSPDQLEGLTTIIKSYRGESVDFTANEWLTSTFESGSYEDVEGLCKVANMDDIIENDYSLTPGRYVGFSIQIDKDFDYQGRMSEIHGELDNLNGESNELMQAIQGLKL
jgi:type I restriction enzyme M protein